MANPEITESDLRAQVSNLLEESRKPRASEERNLKQAVASFVGSSTFATPKSSTFSTASSPGSRTMSRFAGFTSRCTTPALWA